jgi:hypothetical protein
MMHPFLDFVEAGFPTLILPGRHHRESLGFLVDRLRFLQAFIYFLIIF